MSLSVLYQVPLSAKALEIGIPGDQLSHPFPASHPLEHATLQAQQENAWMTPVLNHYSQWYSQQ